MSCAIRVQFLFISLMRCVRHDHGPLLVSDRWIQKDLALSDTKFYFLRNLCISVGLGDCSCLFKTSAGLGVATLAKLLPGLHIIGSALAYAVPLPGFR